MQFKKNKKYGQFYLELNFRRTIEAPAVLLVFDLLNDSAISAAFLSKDSLKWPETHLLATSLFGSFSLTVNES